MCNKNPTQEMIKANETTDSEGVTFCTLENWSSMAEEIPTSHKNRGKFIGSCWCCGKGICQEKFFVHMRIDGGIFKADAEMTDEYESANSQGWFPIGASCAKNYKGYCRVLK